MSSKVTSDEVVARHPLYGHTFLVRRLTWNDSDGLSFDVYDEATGECLTAGSYDDEPGPDDIEELLEMLQFARDSVSLDPFFDNNQTILGILDDVARAKGRVCPSCKRSFDEQNSRCWLEDLHWDKDRAIPSGRVVLLAGHRQSADSPDSFGPFDSVAEAREYAIEEVRDGGWDPDGVTIEFSPLGT